MPILRRSIVIPSFHRQRTLIVGWFSVCLHGDRDTEKITAVPLCYVAGSRVFEGSAIRHVSSACIIGRREDAETGRSAEHHQHGRL